MGVRTELYCADDDFRRVDPCGGDFLHLHRVFEELAAADDVGLAPETRNAIGELASCLVWWETVSLYLHEEAKAGRIDDREVDAIDVTSHMVELGFRCPQINWIGIARGRENLDLLHAACQAHGPLDRHLELIRQHQAKLEKAAHKPRFWPFGRRAAPSSPIMEDGFPFTRSNIVEELEMLIEYVERAQGEGYARMMLYMGD